ncbi:hypothetical protein A9J41_07560, partial [Laribacter hongkongensis]
MEDDRMRSMAHLRVLMAIGNHSDKNGWSRPSLKRIGVLAGKKDKPLSKPYVSEIISDLEAWGYLTRNAQTRDDGGQTSNLYRVIFDCGDPEPCPLDPVPDGADPHSVSQNPPFGMSEPPVWPHRNEPPVRSHGTEPHKNNPIEQRKEKTTVDQQAKQPAADAVVPADADTADKVHKPRLDPQRLLDLFHEHCPTLPKVRLLTDSRKQAMRSRWVQVSRDMGRYDTGDVQAGLEWWGRFFRAVHN